MAALERVPRSSLLEYGSPPQQARSVANDCRGRPFEATPLPVPPPGPRRMFPIWTNDQWPNSGTPEFGWGAGSRVWLARSQIPSACAWGGEACTSSTASRSEPGGDRGGDDMIGEADGRVVRVIVLELVLEPQVAMIGEQVREHDCRAGNDEKIVAALGQAPHDVGAVGALDQRDVGADHQPFEQAVI